MMLEADACLSVTVVHCNTGVHPVYDIETGSGRCSICCYCPNRRRACQCTYIPRGHGACQALQPRHRQNMLKQPQMTTHKRGSHDAVHAMFCWHTISKFSTSLPWAVHALTAFNSIAHAACSHTAAAAGCCWLLQSVSKTLRSC